MKKAALALLALGALTGCAPAEPGARADAQWAECDIRPNPNRQLQACNAVIDNPSQTAERRATALINRAALRADDGEFARAISDLGRASRLAPNDARVLVARGHIHRQRGAFAAAARAAEAALALDPGMPAALQLREQAGAGRETDDAGQIAQLNAALSRDPRNPALLNERCWLRAVAGIELEAARADCDAALAIDPQFAEALDSRGLVALKQGDYAHAAADYEAALSLQPGRGHFLYGRGLARKAMGDKNGDADLRAGEAAEPGVAALYRDYGVGP